MGRGRNYALTAALLVVVSLTVSATASGKPGYVTSPAERQSQLTVKGTGGFKVTIARLGNRVELTASNGATAAIYVVQPPRTAVDQIQATFPGVGRISVRFHASGPVERLPGFCGGRKSIRRDGIFRGVIRFRGEQGFTQAATDHARGFAYRSFRESCKEKSSHGNSGPSSIDTLTEQAKSPAGQIVFGAAKFTKGSPFAGSSHYFVAQTKRSHGMVSIKVGSASGDSSAFEIAGNPSQPMSAVVTPPAPFKGTAIFNAVPGQLAEWTGMLEVDLPGLGTVPLTGARFSPELCLGRRCVGGPAQ